jgi:membrane-bound lytic murein transglycosylase D
MTVNSDLPNAAVTVNGRTGEVNFPFSINPAIQQYLDYFQGAGRLMMEGNLIRSGRFMRMTRQIFREEGVPVDLSWMAQIESGWNPGSSTTRGNGLWGFSLERAKEYELRMNPWIDERLSFEQSTRAAARYLRNLAKHYNGNWALAMAAYNKRTVDVDTAISKARSSDFWIIQPRLAPDTRDVVPMILATILIAKNPEKYGFKGIRPEAPLAYDVVQVSNATSLQLVAESTDTSVDHIRSLNPELKREVTPRGEAYNVRVPPGKGRQFYSLLKRTSH